MVSGKLISIVLSIAVFIENADADFKNVCRRILSFYGFDASLNKSQAFMYAYEYLTIIPDEGHHKNIIGVVNDYLNELLTKFFEAHCDNLVNMFEDPHTWCTNYKNHGENVSINCAEMMAINEYMTFGTTQKSALEISFLHITNSFDMKPICKEYYSYIKQKIEHVIDYTYARGPWIYCNQVESPPQYFLVIYKNGSTGVYPNQQFHGSPETSLHGITPITYDFFEKSESSSRNSNMRVDDNQNMNIDLNALDQDEIELDLKL